MYVQSSYQNPALPNWSAMSGCLDRGMGCASGGCGCNQRGMGLFATPFDLSSYGWVEWAIVIGGVFVLYSVFSTTSRGVRSVRRKVRYVAGAGERRRKEKAEKLRAEARRIEGDTFGSSKRERKGRF